jgi:hypothetical protein
MRDVLHFKMLPDLDGGISKSFLRGLFGAFTTVVLPGILFQVSEDICFGRLWCGAPLHLYPV